MHRARGPARQADAEGARARPMRRMRGAQITVHAVCARIVHARTGVLLQVPWSRLGKEPVVVEFDRLYILAGPRSEEAGSTGTVGLCAQGAVRSCCTSCRRR